MSIVFLVIGLALAEIICTDQAIEQWETEPWSAWSWRSGVITATTTYSGSVKSVTATHSVTLSDTAIGTVNVSLDCVTDIWNVFTVYVSWDGWSKELSRSVLYTDFPASAGVHTLQLLIDSDPYPNGQLIVTAVNLTSCVEKTVPVVPIVVGSIIACLALLLALWFALRPRCKRKPLIWTTATIVE